MSDTTITELETLLRDERAAVLSGDLAALEPIARIKEDLFSRLAGISRGFPAGKVESLKREAEHNRELLAAAARGLKSVTRRLADIRSAHGPLNTYSRSGERTTLGDRRGALERRA